jgi:AraC-like DNA-binding protein/quercetin dioxygenase-like cupin family protein
MAVRNSIVSQIMSLPGQLTPATPADPPNILVGSFDLAAGRSFPPHTHREHQLVWASSGVLEVTTPDAGWILPPTRAAWVPAGVTHATGASTPATVRSLYLPANCPVTFAEPTAVAVDDVLAALINYLARTDLADGARRRAEAVVYDLITAERAGVIRVPMPRDPRAARVAGAVVADPADGRDLATRARHAGASTRTLTRLFVAETGMSFTRWRTQVRLRAALILLAGGTPVAVVARRIGYRTPSAFVAVFRQTLGVTPRHYFVSPRAR